MLTTALMAALLVVCAQMVVPIGPVPFSMALFGVYFAGAMLPPLWAAAALAIYILLGVAGLPVFAGFQAGPQVLVGPTGGYLIGYFLLALSVGLAMRYTQKPWLVYGTALGGMAGFYLLGTLWYMLLTGSSLVAGLAICVLPFVVPDILKMVFALLLAQAVQRRQQHADTH